MATIDSIAIRRLIAEFKHLQSKVTVPLDYDAQVVLVKDFLTNDDTGLVTTIFDFMVHCGDSVPLKLETGNDTLNNILSLWQKQTLNKNFSIDVQRGLREVTAQYLRERYTSSQIVLHIDWATQKINGQNWSLPSRMWFYNGGSVRAKNKKGAINTKEYEVKINNEWRSLNNKGSSSILIQRPFNSWYETKTTPYFVRRGVLKNALLKKAIIQKQTEVIDAVIPYLLTLKSGSDNLAKMGQLATEEQMLELKEKLIAAVKEKNLDGIKSLLAVFSYDTNLEHLMPDLIKIFNPDILKNVDKDLLAGLGLIELKGFASNREETILNPKVLVEEIKDAISDWSRLLENVMMEILERNSTTHRNLSQNNVKIVTGLIRAFLTNDMKTMLRSLFDRGIISYRSSVENIAELDFESELEMNDQEWKDNLRTRLYPRLTQNQEQHSDPNLDNTLPDRQPGTPEVDNFKATDPEFIKNELEEVMAPYDKNSELPDAVKNNMSSELQTVFRRVVNQSLKRGDSETVAFKKAWAVIKQIGHKNKEGDWVKSQDMTIDHIPDEDKQSLSIAEQIKYVKRIVK